MQFHKSFGRSVEALAFPEEVRAAGGGIIFVAQHVQVRLGSLTVAWHWETYPQPVPADQCRPVVDFWRDGGYRGMTLLRRWSARVVAEWRPGEGLDDFVDGDPLDHLVAAGLIAEGEA